MKEIHDKGFSLVRGKEEYSNPSLEFSKLKVGTKTLGDATIQLGDFHFANPRLATKRDVLRAIDTYDLPMMREISDFFYKTSGIYSRILRYMAFMYRYDWYVTPYVNDESIGKEKIESAFDKCLLVLDKFGAKRKFGEIALKVLRHGCYYGYKIPYNGTFTLQELPPDYCRSRINEGNKPAVEFNMKFFDDYFRDITQRQKMLNVFPDEFKKGYHLYHKHQLPPLFLGDEPGWFMLDPANTVKFTANGEDHPMFISVIPLILDLDEAQALDRKKTMQRLLKIIIQKMPLDKNGELIFDVEEAQQLHNNAVQMLGRAIGIDVLTTFADTEVANLSDSNAANTQTDDLKRVERQLFNEAGVSQMQFNTDGNIALEKSQINDAATMYNLLLQFEDFLNELIQPFNKSKISFRVEMLPTTIYNYQELAKTYKEMASIGYSKFLPQIALGHSQRSILANAYFENDVLKLVESFIPPISSNNMNTDMVKKSGDGNTSGRPEKPDDQKSTKTIQNRESMS